MSDLNQVTFTGRLGADPEIRSAGNNKVANLRLAVGEQWKSKDGEKKESTEWVSVTIWGDGLVGVVERFLNKGSKILVQGKWKTRKWQDKDGNDRYSTECVLQGFDSKLIMLDGKSDGGSRDNGGQRQQENRSSGSQQSNQSVGSWGDDLDDDLPPF